MKALVTGGCGFIGRAVVTHFLEKTDWEVVIVDSLTYASDVNLLLVDPSWNPARVKIYFHDLRSPIPDTLKKKIGAVRYIFNLASESHVDRSILDPVPFVTNNVLLALNVFEFARQVQPEKVFQISTDEVYGPAADGYAFKEWERHLPSNPYAASKSAQESLAIAYWRTYGIPLILTNTMNNFGPGQHAEKYLPKIIRCLATGKAVPVHGEPINGHWLSGSRSWLYTRNHADALLFLAQEISPERFPDGAWPTRYHIAGDEEITNLDLVYRVAAILRVKPRYQWVDFHSSRPGHDRRYALDGSKLRALWKPPFPLEDSLRLTMDAYHANSEHESSQPQQ